MAALESGRTVHPADDIEAFSRKVATELRSQVLVLQPQDIEAESAQASTSVWGVVIETAHPDAVASLVALIDGSVSLYVSDGTGCIGCGADEEVRRTGADLLQLARHTVVLAMPTTDVAYPPQGSVRFYFLSFDGLRAAQLRLEELSGVDAGLGALYFAGQRVLNAVERLGAGQSLAREIRFALQDSSFAANKGSPSCLSVGSAVRRLRT